MTSGRRAHWDRAFSARKDTALSWYQDVPQPSLELIETHGPGPSAAVIDIGAGTGRLAAALLDRGYADVTLLDVSPAALEASRARLGGRASSVCFIVADITAWRPQRQFGVWHDRAVMHFLVDPADQAAYRAALLAGTRPGSAVVLGTFSPDGPETCSGLPVHQWTGVQLLGFLGPDTVELLEARRHAHVTPAGARQDFEFSVFRRK